MWGKKFGFNDAAHIRYINIFEGLQIIVFTDHGSSGGVVKIRNRNNKSSRIHSLISALISSPFQHRFTATITTVNVYRFCHPAGSSSGDPLAILGVAPPRGTTDVRSPCYPWVYRYIIGYPMFSHGKRYRCCFLKAIYFLKNMWTKTKKTDNIPVKVEP